MTFTKEMTKFKLWAPTATEVEVVFYEKNKQLIHPLQRTDQGVWQHTIKGNLDGRSIHGIAF
ncbi:hypothetical protein KHA80_15865 [Anaerobacillus sp. HL2]|nr:hypothetical protein KHA80_15865 [Anaerobacillus sp. HL2]